MRCHISLAKVVCRQGAVSCSLWRFFLDLHNRLVVVMTLIVRLDLRCDFVFLVLRIEFGRSVVNCAGLWPVPG